MQIYIHKKHNTNDSLIVVVFPAPIHFIPFYLSSVQESLSLCVMSSFSRDETEDVNNNENE